MAEPLSPAFLATAIEAVIGAGDVQMAHVGRAIDIRKKGTIDLVTEIDINIERAFRDTIAARFPDHVVLGEEFVEAGEREQIPPYCWLFDPVDGTTNYAHGLPIFCSSLALEIDGSPVVAAVYDPNRRELFTAERGQGARLNGEPIHVSAAETLIDSLLVTGFHYDVHKDPGELVGLFAEMLGRARAVRRLGSAAIDLCYVACGRLDGFWEKRLQPWDVAAGALIVAEAGGRVTAMSGTPYGSREGSVLATNGGIHGQMLDAIREFGLRWQSRVSP
ncbi:MAG TPA: inositol monophosphatase family protein [Vicinamibacterales bacterium]|nr:inositol monophosphatase family protein [Vicinamibacterales bacterium]